MEPDTTPLWITGPGTPAPEHAMGAAVLSLLRWAKLRLFRWSGDV